MAVRANPNQRKLYDLATSQNPPRLISLWGDTGSGKTIGGLRAMYGHSRRRRRPHYMLIAPTQGSVEDNLVPILEGIAEEAKAPFKYRAGSRSPHVKIGDATFHIYGADNKRSARRIQGFSGDGAFSDETPLQPENFWMMMWSRLRSGGFGQMVISTANPEGPAHWYKTKILDRIDAWGGQQFYFPLDENYLVSQEYKDSLHNAYTGHWARRYLHGEWVNPTGLVYPVYYEHYAPTALRPEKVCMVIDPAMTGTTAVHLYEQYWDARHRVFEWYLTREYRHNGHEQGYRDMPTTLKHILGRGETDLQWPLPHLIIYDPADPSVGFAAAAMGLQAVSADNTVDAGVMAAQSLLHRGIIKVAPNLTNTKQQLSTYSFKEDTDRPDDNSTSDHADFMMCLRYFAKTELLVNDPLYTIEQKAEYWNGQRVL